MRGRHDLSGPLGLRWLRGLVASRAAGAGGLAVRVLPEAPAPEARLRLLAFADAAGAPLQIALLRPLRAAMAAGACRIHLVTEAEETAWRLAGASPAQEALRLLWEAARPHAVFISRYGGALAPAIVAMAQRRHTPLIYHLDDNPFAVPPGAGAKATGCNAAERQAAMRHLLANADLAYLSTGRLRDQLAEAELLPSRPEAVWVGAIASASDPLPPARPRSGGPVLGYMASAAHGQDLALALPGIEAALRHHPAARFEIYGSLPMPGALAGRFGERVLHHPAVPDYDAFLRGLRDLGWHWGIAPLQPGPSNAARTDTKWVEYAAAGIPCLASRHAVYAECLEAGAAVPVEDDGWLEALPAALADGGLRAEILEAARQRLVRRHGLARMTRQLAEALRRAGVLGLGAELPVA